MEAVSMKDDRLGPGKRNIREIEHNPIGRADRILEWQEGEGAEEARPSFQLGKCRKRDSNLPMGERKPLEGRPLELRRRVLSTRGVVHQRRSNVAYANLPSL